MLRIDDEDVAFLSLFLDVLQLGVVHFMPTLHAFCYFGVLVVEQTKE
jgi:hypothetical protein